MKETLGQLGTGTEPGPAPAVVAEGSGPRASLALAASRCSSNDAVRPLLIVIRQRPDAPRSGPYSGRSTGPDRVPTLANRARRSGFTRAAGSSLASNAGIRE